MKHTTVIVSGLFIAALVPLMLVADVAPQPSEPPHSAKARDAIEKHRSAADKLRTDYYTKLIAADEQFVKELDVAIKTAAANNSDTAEIERIVAARSAAQASLQQHKDELRGPLYTLWHLTTPNSGGQWQIWLNADRTSLNQIHDHGKWERNGNRLIIRWGGDQVDTITISDDGQTFMGVNKLKDKLVGTLIGTNLTGADAPPK